MREERRRFIRIYTNVKVRYKHLGREETARTSTLVNLGETGLRFLCGEKLARGDTLSLDFQLPPKPETISASAEVIWTNELREDDRSFYEVGLKFVDIDPEDQAAIQRFVQEELIAERGRRVKAYFAA